MNLSPPLTNGIFFSAYDPVIHAGRYTIHDPIKRREHGKADQRGSNEQADVRKAEQQEHLADHRKGEGKVHTGESQRQHEHQEHRREKPHECVQRVPDAQCQPVSHTQNDDPQDRQKPVASWRLLTGILRLQKVHCTAAPRADDSGQSIYHENRHIAYHCSENGLKVQLDAVIDLSVHQVDHPQLRQLGKRRAQRQPADQRDGRRDRALPKYDPGNVPPAHAQYIVQAEFPRSSAIQERIGVEQKDQREQQNDEAAECHDRFDRLAALGQFFKSCGRGQVKLPSPVFSIAPRCSRTGADAA